MHVRFHDLRIGNNRLRIVGGDCMTELLPCPFCGGEAETLTAESMYGGYLFGIMCNDCRSRGDVYDTEAEAIAAWNSRAPIEYDGWFYLPKPKEGIVDYGEPEITRTENGYKVWNTANVVDEAARRWGEELGEYVMQRICEIWNTRAERTCEFVDDSDSEPSPPKCSACGYDPGIYECAWYEDGTYGYERNYCPNCGARVVGE